MAQIAHCKIAQCGFFLSREKNVYSMGGKKTQNGKKRNA